MGGEVTALLSVVCYAASNVLLKRGQEDTLKSDNGLFPVLAVSGFILTFSMILDIFDDPAPLIVGDQWPRSLVFCILAGITATCLGRLFLYASIARIGATRGSIVIAMAPLVTLGIAVFLLNEALTWSDIVGIVILFCGIAFLLLESILFSKRGTASWVRSAVVVAVCAAVFQGIGYSFRKVGSAIPIDPIFAAALDTLSAILTYGLILGARGRITDHIRYYLRHLNLFILTAGCMMAAAVFLFFKSVSSAPVSTVSVIMGSQPVIVAMLSGLFMRRFERLTWMTIVSSVLVSVGVVFLGMW